MSTHTHVGRIIRPARDTSHRWRNGHLGEKARPDTRVHALTVEGDGYRALCGVRVEGRYGNESDLDGPITGHVREGTDGVTCERCHNLLIGPADVGRPRAPIDLLRVGMCPAELGEVITDLAIVALSEHVF
jgi:hypothetical protein